MDYDYEILNEVGRGSYGVIYKIRLKNQILVLKEVNLETLNLKQQNDAYKEAQLMSKISHPNLIQYHSSYLYKNKLRIIMEYAESDLAKVTGEVREAQIWAWSVQILQGLEYLHRLNIIHRDIKLNNILLSNNVCKIGDLGVSKVTSSNLLAKTRVGTPLYLAPEQIKNKPYDNKVDIWALGCVLYHLCQRQPPFVGQNFISLGYNIVNKPHRPIDARYTRKLSTLITKMLNKVPEFRPSAVQCLEFIKGEGSEQSKQQTQDLIRGRKIFSTHSQCDISQDLGQQSCHQQAQLKRLQRIVSNQKESQERVTQADKLYRIVVNGRLRRNQSEHQDYV